MDKREYKLEKLKLRVEQDRFYAGELEKLLKNPIFEYALGMLFIAYLTRGNQSVLEKLSGIDVMATSWGLGLTGVITAQQLSAALPYLAPVGEKLLGQLSLGGLLK